MSLPVLLAPHCRPRLHSLTLQSPIQQDILKDLGVDALKITTGAVCVYPNMVAHAVKFLEGTGIPVASVAAGFPAGMTSMKQRLQEIEEAVADGAREIDIVISRQHVLQGNWTALYDEVSAPNQTATWPLLDPTSPM